MTLNNKPDRHRIESQDCSVITPNYLQCSSKLRCISLIFLCHETALLSCQRLPSLRCTLVSFWAWQEISCQEEKLCLCKGQHTTVLFYSWRKLAFWETKRIKAAFSNHAGTIVVTCKSWLKLELERTLGNMARTRSQLTIVVQITKCLINTDGILLVLNEH